MIIPTAGGTDTYWYLGTGEQVVRIANSGGTTTDSILDPAGNRLGVKAAGTVNWLLPDLHGSVAGGLDAAATSLTGAIRYDGYGGDRSTTTSRARRARATSATRAGSTSAPAGYPAL